MVRFTRAAWLAGPALALAAAGPQAHAQKTAIKHHPVNQTRGQGQMVGGSGRFGVVYTLNNGFNFEILSARFTVEPFTAYHSVGARADGKLLVIDFAIKNATPSDNFFNDEQFITAVDSTGQLYKTSNVALASLGVKDNPKMSLRPGQGYGQPALHDPLSTVIELPAKARIVKLMLKYGRQYPKDETFRYYIAGATKAEAGEEGDPKNVIAPLPEDVRDPADPSGATALPEGKGTIGQPVPSGLFHLTLDGLSYTNDSPVGRDVPKGKRFAIATVTAKLMMDYGWGGKPSDFDLKQGDALVLTDADGEKYTPGVTGDSGGGYLKAKRPESADHKFAGGDEYTYRIVWEIPTDAVAKKLVLCVRDGRRWAYDVSNLK